MGKAAIGVFRKAALFTAIATAGIGAMSRAQDSGAANGARAGQRGSGSSSVTTAGAQATSQSAPTTAKVTRGSLDLTFTAPGTFEPVEPLEVRVRPRAYQGDLYVVSAAAPGALVPKGQTILEIDSTQLRRQVTAAEFELKSARAGLAKAQADASLGEAADALALTMQKDDVKNAEDGLKWWLDVDGSQMLRNAELAVRNSKDSVGDQEDELDQLRKMYKSEELTNATADIVVKRALRQLERARIGLEMTEARSKKVKDNDYENAKAKVTFAVDQQKQALSRLEAQQAQAKVQREAALATTALAVESAEERLKFLQSDLAQFTVTAPADVRVFYGQLVNGAWQNNQARALRPGEKVTPQHVLMTATVPGRLQVVADLPEAKVSLVRTGMKAKVMPAALPGTTIPAVAQAPAPAAVQGAQGFAVVLDAQGELPPGLMAGMKSSVRFDAGKADDCLLIPVSFVKDAKVSRRRADGTVEEIEVVVGRGDGEMIEVREGLSEGDDLVKDGGRKKD